MAKELPYFKFYIGEWNDGDITLEDYDIQGLFINVCCYYWAKECDLSMVNLRKKFKSNNSDIDKLIESGILKIDGEFASISFLNEQWKSKEVQVITNRMNGLKGGRPKKDAVTITETKPNGLIFDNRNNNPNETNIDYSKEEKIKEDKSKEKKIFTPPLLSDVLAYFKDNGYSEMSAIKAFNYYEVADWKDSKGNKVKNWKQKMQGVWFKDENLDKGKPQRNSFVN